LLLDEYHKHESVYDMKLVHGLPGDNRIFTWINPNQSIVSLINYKDRVIDGSSVFGGLGATPLESRGKISEWDLIQQKVLWEDTIDNILVGVRFICRF
jgi:hypothetical protein